MRPVVYEVSVGVDRVGLREVLLDQPHDVGHLQLGLVNLVPNAVGLVHLYHAAASVEPRLRFTGSSLLITLARRIT